MVGKICACGKLAASGKTRCSNCLDSNATREKARGSLEYIRNRKYKIVEWKNLGRPPCELCGKRIALSAINVDHILPRSRGGSHALHNLRVVHGRCNSARRSSRDGKVILRKNVVRKRDR